MLAASRCLNRVYSDFYGVTYEDGKSLGIKVVDRQSNLIVLSRMETPKTEIIFWCTEEPKSKRVVFTYERFKHNHKGEIV